MLWCVIDGIAASLIRKATRVKLRVAFSIYFSLVGLCFSLKRQHCSQVFMKGAP